jgi:hypothetical protein
MDERIPGHYILITLAFQEWLRVGTRRKNHG